ncbi:MAG: MarR family transcriptional regulator [Hyphomicrobiales bacterium]
MPVKTSAKNDILHDRTTYRFSILAARQTRCLSEMYVQKFGLSVSQWKVLPIIGYYGPMSAKNVGERTSLAPEKVTRSVDQLVIRGYVIRRADPKDRRRVVLSLAAKGRDVFNESEKIRGAIEDEFLAALQPQERATFHRLLDKLERRALVMFNGKKSWQKIISQSVSVGNSLAKARKRPSQAAKLSL